MFLRCTYRGRIAGVVVLTAMVASAARALAQGNLFTAPPNTLTTSSHYVSTTAFTWFATGIGQVSGPWVPLEGRDAWDGTPAFFESQVKQIMAANIDVMLVEQYSTTANGGFCCCGNYNLFLAMSNLRAQGYNVPKVAPLLDPSISVGTGWPGRAAGTCLDLSASADKDTFVQVYSDFYKTYYAANTDAYADSYIAQLGGRVLLDSSDLQDGVSVKNVSSLTRADVQSRLTSALGADHALFNNMPTTGTFMINSIYDDKMAFQDESLAQFETNASYYYRDTTIVPSLGYRAAMVKPGFWNQNTINPGAFLPRDGGSHYKSAWASAQAARSGSSGIKHVNVESWNEYDEGSGCYAANPGSPYIKNPPNNSGHTDTWSSSNDPYEYIKDTAAGARAFNDTPDLGATVLWNNLPTAMGPGQTLTVQVIVRNDGDVSWTGAAGFKLGEPNDPTMFGPGRYLIDDTTNEIPTYGGIFRGRPITFNVQLTAPTIYGTYTTHWQMEENGAWFGQEVTVPIPVALYGDANLDGTVNFTDLNTLLTNYNKAGDWTKGDFNNDGIVNFTDLNALLTDYNHSLALDVVPAYDGLDAAAIRALSLAGVTVVPEPSPLIMLAVALIGASPYTWRKGNRGTLIATDLR